jgi:hypothetical protein
LKLYGAFGDETAAIFRILGKRRNATVTVEPQSYQLLVQQLTIQRVNAALWHHLQT